MCLRLISLFLSFPRLSYTALVLAMACFSATSYAERNDRDKPLNFVADSAQSDEAKQTSILMGRVELTKGSMILRSARVEIRQNKDGSQFAIATGGNQGRSYFRQKREGLDEYIEGEAERIEYDGQGGQVRFIGRAQMRRLRDASVTDEIAGQTITYNNNSEVFQVDGGPTSAAPGGRVRGVISPRTVSSAAEANNPTTRTTVTTSKPTGDKTP